MALLADFESDVIFKVAEALRVPVMILTMLALAVVLVELGAFAVELTRRRRRDFRRLELATARRWSAKAEKSARSTGPPTAGPCSSSAAERSGGAGAAG